MIPPNGKCPFPGSGPGSTVAAERPQGRYGYSKQAGRSVMHQEMMIPADGVDSILLLLGGPNSHDRAEALRIRYHHSPDLQEDSRGRALVPVGGG